MPEVRVVILQSNYIPWKGYFDLINLADVFVFYDDVQYTHDDWRNRNKIVTKDGLKWLTIPVGRDMNRKINEVTFSDQSWKQEHCRLIIENYRNCAGFDQELLEQVYNNDIHSLSEFNQHAIQVISDYLGLSTVFRRVEDFRLCKGKTERLIDLLTQLNATEYITGPSAENYLDESLFQENNIQLTYFDYSDYPTYDQKYQSFEHGVSVLDMIFNTGVDARNFLKTT